MTWKRRCRSTGRVVLTALAVLASSGGATLAQATIEEPWPALPPRMVAPNVDSLAQFRVVPDLSLAGLLKQGFVVVGVDGGRVWVQRRDEAYRCGDGTAGITCEQLVEPYVSGR